MSVLSVCNVGVLWPNGWMNQDETWHGGGPQTRPIVLDGDPALVPQKGGRSPFSAHFCCGQAAGCIKMPLGMEVGLGSGDFVLDGYPASPPQKGGGAPPIFGPLCLLWPNSWMDEDATWYGCRHRLGHIVLEGTRLPAKGAQQPPSFRPMSIVATVAHLGYC